MNKVKYDSDLIKIITFFESMTGSKVKDCISNGGLTFIIGENDMGKAIGKNGVNIKRMENALKRKIKLVEFNPNVAQFVKNILYPIETLDVSTEGGAVIIKGKDVNSKAKIIGRERQNINHIVKITKRYFDVNEIKVV